MRFAQTCQDLSVRFALLSGAEAFCVFFCLPFCFVVTILIDEFHHSFLGNYHDAIMYRRIQMRLAMYELYFLLVT